MRVVGGAHKIAPPRVGVLELPENPPAGGPAMIGTMHPGLSKAYAPGSLERGTVSDGVSALEMAAALAGV